MNDGAASSNNLTADSTRLVTVVGRLTDEGIECPALRGDDGQLYTLLGRDLGELPVETRVSVTGERLDFSSCQQGITIKVRSISPAVPRET